MTQPEHSLLGIPVSRKDRLSVHIDYYAPPAGSIQTACSLCALLVWIGPAQQKKKQANPAMEIICPLCLITEMRKAGASADELKVSDCGGISGSFILKGGPAHFPKTDKN